MPFLLIISRCDMETINANNLNEYLNSETNSIPIIICTDKQRVKKAIMDAGYQGISINALLAKELLKYEQEDRAKKVEIILKRIVAPYDTVFIKDFEMLFDPRYKIDIIKLFCDLARHHKVIVMWPGQYQNEKLTYADTEDLDYHEYNCNFYQMQIVQ